ncbi:MAG: hypothetical protein FWF77_01030 [Defluviitaleaceae bacterium]|nr:hypothetical protein [Defluviitaleaceae bacterium]
MSAATRSLEAGSNFDTGNMCRRRRVPSKPGAISEEGQRRKKNESASVTRRLVFADAFFSRDNTLLRPALLPQNT